MLEAGTPQTTPVGTDDKPCCQKKPGLHLLVLILVILATAGAVFFITRKNCPKFGDIVCPPCPTGGIEDRTGQITPLSQNGEIKWERVQGSGSYTFEYPFGWHVAILWPNSLEEGINTYIDPKPINTAPRGGWLAEIEINSKNGLKNPEEVFRQEMEEFKKSLEDIKEETIQTEIGAVYHISGSNSNTIMGSSTSEIFYTLITPQNLSDSLNYQVISVESYNPANSGIVKRIATSFKRPSL